MSIFYCTIINNVYNNWKRYRINMQRISRTFPTKLVNIHYILVFTNIYYLWSTQLVYFVRSAESFLEFRVHYGIGTIMEPFIKSFDKDINCVYLVDVKSNALASLYEEAIWQISYRPKIKCLSSSPFIDRLIDQQFGFESIFHFFNLIHLVQFLWYLQHFWCT